MKKIVAFVFVIAGIVTAFLYISGKTSNESELATANKLPALKQPEALTKQDQASEKLQDAPQLIANEVKTSPLRRPYKNEGVVLTLTKENVPEPFYAFGRNILLNWEDFQAIKRRYDEQGQPFDYARLNSDEKLGWVHWWVERIGVNEEGEEVYRLIDLLSFTEKSFEILAKLQEREFELLFHQLEFGELNNELENYARESFSYYLKNDADFSLSPIVCRQRKCLIKVTFETEPNFNILEYSHALEANMQAQVGDEHKCHAAWDVVKPFGNIIRVVCAQQV